MYHAQCIVGLIGYLARGAYHVFIRSSRISISPGGHLFQRYAILHQGNVMLEKRKHGSLDRFAREIERFFAYLTDAF